ncbi:MAG: hypothetical protein PVSMB7_10350 [Chloroflexota bacterium]
MTRSTFTAHDNTECVKLAIKQLVASRVILARQETRRARHGGGEQRETRVRLAPHDRHLLPRPLAQVVDALEQAIKHSPDKPEISLRRFRITRVADRPALEELTDAGFYTAEKRPALVFFTRTVHVITQSGRELRTTLHAGLAHGTRHFSEWVDQDPQRARRFLTAAGSAALLVPTIETDLPRLRERLMLQGGGVADMPDIGPEQHIGPLAYPGARSFSESSSAVDPGDAGDLGGLGDLTDIGDLDDLGDLSDMGADAGGDGDGGNGGNGGNGD